jgi:hypothetical protein
MWGPRFQPAAEPGPLGLSLAGWKASSTVLAAGCVLSERYCV